MNNYNNNDHIIDSSLFFSNDEKDSSFSSPDYCASIIAAGVIKINELPQTFDATDYILPQGLERIDGRILYWKQNNILAVIAASPIFEKSAPSPEAQTVLNHLLLKIGKQVKRSFIGKKSLSSDKLFFHDKQLYVLNATSCVKVE